MMITSRRWFIWAALALSLTAGLSCDGTPSGPSIEQVVRAHDEVNSSALTLVRDQIPIPPPDLDVSAVIGPAGGIIKVLGHKLVIPKDAVTLPTLFTMQVLTTGFIEVELTATRTDLLGQVIDVGALGFNKPVALRLTYKRSPDTLDPTKLVIVHVDGTTLTALPSKVNTDQKTVSAKLRHFSKYAMASN